MPPSPVSGAFPPPHQGDGDPILQGVGNPIIPARRGPAANVLDPKNLHVFAAFFNFNRRDSLVRNFLRFQEHCRQLGVTLHVVELVLGNMPFEITTAYDHLHTQLRTDSEFFQKENLINVGIRNALITFPEMEYIAWVDTDVTFFNRTVAIDTMYLLNRHPVVQMWSMANDLDPDGHPLVYKNNGQTQVAMSLAYCHQHHYPVVPANFGFEWHSGYAWAMRRSTWEALGGLYENTIIGAADYHMAWAFIGRPAFGIHGKASAEYIKDAMAWCERAARIIRSDLGCVRGLIHHHWHGRKVDRRYVERWSVIVDHGFSPSRDLWKDGMGLLHLTDRNPQLRYAIREYMASRNDDANTVT
jgi:hypothetical protein